MNPDEYREAIVNVTSRRLRTKYDRGQKEHGGNLWDRPALPEAINEVIDLVTYIHTVEVQLAEIDHLLEEVLVEMCRTDVSKAEIAEFINLARKKIKAQLSK